MTDNGMKKPENWPAGGAGPPARLTEGEVGTAGTASEDTETSAEAAVDATSDTISETPAPDAEVAAIPASNAETAAETAAAAAADTVAEAAAAAAADTEAATADTVAVAETAAAAETALETAVAPIADAAAITDDASATGLYPDGDEDEDEDEDEGARDIASRRKEAEARLKAARSRAPKRRTVVTGEPKKQPPKVAPKIGPIDRSQLKWYVVHTYSGYENKAKQAIEQRVRTQELEHKFGDILVPTESVVEMRKGKRRTSNRKFFPGYILAQLVLDDETYHLVKSTPKVTSFLGEQQGRNPTPVSEAEMQDLTQQMTEGASKPKPKVLFEAGETVRVIDGPFSNFNGLVEDVRPEKGKLRVNISIFGRPTPVELDFMQVEKA